MSVTRIPAHFLLQYQSKCYYIIVQEVYYSIGRFITLSGSYYIIGRFLLHYRVLITVSGVITLSVGTAMSTKICPHKMSSQFDRFLAGGLAIRHRSWRRYLCADMLPIRDLCASAFCVCPLFFYDNKSYIISHFATDAIFRCDFTLQLSYRCRHRRLLKTTHNCAQPRRTTHNGRFYSFINTISFHGSRRFIFTGSL